MRSYFIRVEGVNPLNTLLQASYMVIRNGIKPQKKTFYKSMSCFLKAGFLFLFFIFIAVNSFSQKNDMILIKSGVFLMGSPVNEQGRNANESPQRRVTVSSFFIAEFPVTQAEYQSVMNVNPSHFKAPSLPVEQVSWYDAVEYCNKRSIKEGLTPVYTRKGDIVTWNRKSNGYRLPTEAEWEYACRAGTQTPFYTGTLVDEAGWHRGNSDQKSRPVGEKLPNDWGLYDMHGNVLEWCWDWLDYYPSENEVNPLGPDEGTMRVYRGGAWGMQNIHTRSAYRYGNHLNMQSFFVGFRVARNGE